MPTASAYTGALFALDIDGSRVSSLISFGGMAMDADVVVDRPGVEAMPKKRVANVRWTPGTATAGMAMGKGLYSWISESLSKPLATRNGVFTTANFAGQAVSTQTFSNAFLTEFTVPELDAANKAAGCFGMAFQVERVDWAKGDGHDIRNGAANPKSWLCCNFKVEIGNLPCTRVLTVDSFSWTCTPATPADGLPTPSLPPPRGTATVPNIKLGISGVDYDVWAAAARKWFIEGANLEANEMQGRITFLGSNMVDVMGTIELANVGFKRFSQTNADANVQGAQRFDVELYVEKMTLTIKDPGA